MSDHRKYNLEELGLEMVDEYTHRPVRRTKRLRLPRAQTVEEMVAVFHSVAEVPVGETEAFVDRVRTSLRWNLIQEEWEELKTGWKVHEDPVETLDAICDLVYVLVGAAVEFGWSFDEALKRVHESNMSKLTGRIRERDDGKILKGKDFVPPFLEDLV
jgi:predicted HAD superfamily Cof-like phosphohydrolase